MRGRLRLATSILLSCALPSARSFAQEPLKAAVYRATTDRVAMKFAFYSPTGRVGSVDLSEVNRWVETTVEQNTDLDVSELEDQIVDKCVASGRRLTCLVEESSEEWLAMRNSLPANYSEVKHTLRESPKHPRYVLILSAAAVDGGDRLAALLIDVEDALMRVHAKRSRSGRPTAEEMAEVEDEISRFSVIARPPVEEQITSSEKVKRYLTTLIEEQLKQAFIDAGRWRPFGSIEVEVESQDPFSVEIDGVSMGTTIGGRATLLDVRPGARHLVLKNEDFEEYAADVQVETAKPAVLHATVIKKPSRLIFAVRQTVLWGGVLSAAAGVGLMVYGAVAKGSHNRTEICIGGDDPNCDTPFLRFGDGPESATASGNGSGAPIIPLGYSLVGLGTAWMLGPLIDDDEERIPWIEAVVGIAVFGAAFGISLAADRSDQVCMYHQTC